MKFDLKGQQRKTEWVRREKEKEKERQKQEQLQFSSFSKDAKTG